MWTRRKARPAQRYGGTQHWPPAVAIVSAPDASERRQETGKKLLATSTAVALACDAGLCTLRADAPSRSKRDQSMGEMKITLPLYIGDAVSGANQTVGIIRPQLRCAGRVPALRGAAFGSHPCGRGVPRTASMPRPA